MAILTFAAMRANEHSSTNGKVVYNLYAGGAPTAQRAAAGAGSRASEEDLRASWEALVQSALLDLSVVDTTVEATATEDDVRSFVGAFADSPATTAKGTGIGTEYHVADDAVVGQALVDEAGELMHAFAYAEA